MTNLEHYPVKVNYFADSVLWENTLHDIQHDIGKGHIVTELVSGSLVHSLVLQAMRKTGEGLVHSLVLQAMRKTGEGLVPALAAYKFSGTHLLLQQYGRYRLKDKAQFIRSILHNTSTMSLWEVHVPLSFSVVSPGSLSLSPLLLQDPSLFLHCLSRIPLSFSIASPGSLSLSPLPLQDPSLFLHCLCRIPLSFSIVSPGSLSLSPLSLQDPVIMRSACPSLFLYRIPMPRPVRTDIYRSWTAKTNNH